MFKKTLLKIWWFANQIHVVKNQFVVTRNLKDPRSPLLPPPPGGSTSILNTQTMGLLRDWRLKLSPFSLNGGTKLKKSLETLTPKEVFIGFPTIFK